MLRRRKQTIMFMALITLLSVILTACAGGSAGVAGTGDAASTSGDAKGKLKFGVCLAHIQEERFSREAEMFEEFCRENDIELILQSAEDDMQVQTQQFESMVANDVDVILIHPVDSAGASPLLSTARANGIPVISYDILITNGDLDYYVTFDSRKVGEAIAQFAVDQAPKGNYIWLMGHPGNNNANLLRQGNEAVLNPLIESGQITVVQEQWCDKWDPQIAMNHVENALTQYGNDIQGIIAPNDRTAGGVVQALAAQGLAGQIPVAGQDADLAACMRIAEGTQAGTVYKKISDLNASACQLALALARGEDPKQSLVAGQGSWGTLDNEFKEVDTFFCDIVVINQSNLYEEIVLTGFHSLEDVYADVPRDQWPA